MPRERWRPVPGFPKYLISSEGRLKGPRGLLKLWDRCHGPTALLADGRIIRQRAMRWLVLRTFSGDRPGCLVRHKNGDSRDVRLSNLEWVPAVNAEAKASA